MAIKSQSPSLEPKQPVRRIFTKRQKQNIIKRFQKEMAQREMAFNDSVNNEVKILRLKFNNRLNKILRKFWDVKLEDILNVERELSSETPLSLFFVLKQLESLKSDRSNESEEKSG